MYSSSLQKKKNLVRRDPEKPVLDIFVSILEDRMERILMKFALDPDQRQM